MLSEDGWMDFDIAEYHVVSDPLVLSSSEEDELETEDPVLRIERWMSRTGYVRLQTPEIVALEEEEITVAPYLSEQLSGLTEYQLGVVRRLMVEMLPMLPVSGQAHAATAAAGAGASSAVSSAVSKYRLPRVVA